MSQEVFGELDDIDYLRETDLFSGMPEPVIRSILVQAQTVSYPAGAFVVRRGEPGDRFFVVKSGVVEVVNPSEEADSTPLAYLGRGECFGELALLTNSPRNADVRVPEQAELLVIDRDLFEDLMTTHTGFGRQLCVILAWRLIRLLRRAPMEIAKKQLQGNLRYFDMATVLQTLIGSGQTGIMTFSASRRPVAQLFFQSGNILKVRYGNRSGDEAVHHLFQVQPSGEFHFASSDKALDDRPDPGITMPAMALMMESVRLQDELGLLRQQLPPGPTLLRRRAASLNWKDQEGGPAAKELWTQLEKPATVSDLIEASPSCHYHACRALLRLLETKQVQPAPTPGAP